MNKNLFDTLKDRGYIYQTTNEESVKNILNGKPSAMYVGIDPTAESLHIGHCFPLIVAKYLQDAGHKVIILLGGATAMVGDPSGKTDMRKMVDSDFINNNKSKIEEIISRFIRLDGDNPAILVNNADWFRGYEFVSFMRDIGVHFNVNKMLACDAYTRRLEQGGLTFFEMGYMLMQAYDFVRLHKDYGCVLEFGGSDQWANIVAGSDLGRKLALLENKEEIYEAFTTPLLTNYEGKKMGKTEKGALWVDKNKTTPYEFYQYFYNVDDKDVEKLFKVLTYVPLDEVAKIMSGDIRDAKSRMAYEITKLVHGEAEADNALKQAKDVFSGNDLSNAPEVELEKSNAFVLLPDLLVNSGLCSSKSEARRMMEQNAIALNDEKVKDFTYMISDKDFNDGFAILKKGKKNIIKVTLK
ncbi:MAG: tyrosine--tRNA ligase [Clostridia bacterium]|nr:tyrosine--tRNA ligase [Clostridia bacterium]